MIECMLAAPSSGSGKTALACALLAALQKRGLAPCAFKCGPDYIDPMFHRSVLGVESHNLDLFLCGEDAARTLYARHAAGHGAAVVEGVMGFYDGVGGVTARASAWHVARTLDLPVLLVLRPRGASLTLAAQVRGLLAFRQPSHIAGILLNSVFVAAEFTAGILSNSMGLLSDAGHNLSDVASLLLALLDPIAMLRESENAPRAAIPTATAAARFSFRCSTPSSCWSPSAPSSSRAFASCSIPNP